MFIYDGIMRTVNIGDLKNQLSAYLQHVRNGEEIVVCDRNTAVARILPIASIGIAEQEKQLVASGSMTLPQHEMDWNSFWAIRRGKVSDKVARKAAIESRGDR
jgi:prevent-host-death family protein